MLRAVITDEALLSFANAARRTITAMEEACRRAELAHRRAALLRAYRRRKQWRKAYVRRLLNLGVPMPRIQRVVAGRGRGRGVVQGYQPLGANLVIAARTVEALFSPTTLPHKRVALLKQTPWRPYVVEALYRAEYDAAKKTHEKSPASTAERSVARCLGMTEALVHKICGKVRQERNREDVPSDPPVRVDEFETWKKNGGDLWTETDTDHTVEQFPGIAT
jgi:hypothetical protein